MNSTEAFNVNDGTIEGRDEQYELSNRRKRSVQYPNDYDSTSYTPKRNRMDNYTCTNKPNVQSPVSNQHQQRSDIQVTSTFSNAYFNTYNKTKNTLDDSSSRLKHESPRVSFPPFRITLNNTTVSITEVAIIKELNHLCKLNLTYGRYTKTKDNNKCFLLYASTNAQFEHLMQMANWPTKICNSEYKLDLPIKIPSSYSIVVLNVPSQWNEQTFGNELKQHYPTIVRAVRLFVKNGRPLNKIRLDFSSYKELSTILKTRRILLDDNNTAFTIEPYQAPTRVLRCYNCQAYNDHIAAHCPNKNDPICFRCGQHHAYNPQCNNPIRCVHCNGDHMAGSPACPKKIEQRNEINQRQKIPNKTTDTTIQQRKPAWSGNTTTHLFGHDIATNRNHNTDKEIDCININILEKINNTMLCIKDQQDKLNSKFNSFERKLNCYVNDVNQLKSCINDIICPLIKEISSQLCKSQKE